MRNKRRRGLRIKKIWGGGHRGESEWSSRQKKRTGGGLKEMIERGKEEE